ncbi:MAG: O-succinylbenzoic acid--CoA ligase, partial [Owenweeksia sp.]
QKLKDHPGEIWHTYGMTETISHVAMRRVNGSDNDVFRALPGVSFQVDQRGCLVINAPDIGVENLLTNDTVELVDTTSFRWLGRFDNVVNSGGIKLHPEAIESKIGEWGQPFFLAGVPDDALGEKLIMVVESEQPVLKSQLKSLFKGFAPYEVPKEIRTVSTFEYTANGKLNRPATLLKI